MHTDRLFCKLVVDVHVCHCEERARLVRGAAEFASDDRALMCARRVFVCARDLDRRARVVALKGVFVEAYGEVVLGDHVKVLRQRTIGDKPSPSR